MRRIVLLRRGQCALYELQCIEMICRDHGNLPCIICSQCTEEWSVQYYYSKKKTSQVHGAAIERLKFSESLQGCQHGQKSIFFCNIRKRQTVGLDFHFAQLSAGEAV